MNLKKRNLQTGILRNAGGLKIPLCLVILILLCVNLNAQVLRLTPDEAVEMALKNNLSLVSSQASLETKKRASALSWNQFIPNVTVGGGVAIDNQKTVQGSTLVPILDPNAPRIPFEREGISGNFVPLFPNPALPVPSLTGFLETNPIEVSRFHIAYSIQASLNISIAMFENMNRLRHDYQTGILGYEKAKAQLERDVRKMYHSILLLQENIALLRSSFTNADRQVQMAQANYNAGLAPELTLLQARVGRENLRPVIDQAENGMKLSMASFAMYLGMNYDTQFELVPVRESINYINLDISETISRAAAGKPDIKELRQTILMMQSARKAQVYALLPSLSLSWGTTPAYSWFGDSGRWVKPGQLSIMLGLRVHSLLPFSTDSQGIRSMDDQIKVANLGLTQMINGTEIEVYNLILELERAHTSATALQQTVDLAERAYRLTEQAYQAGLQDFFQVQNAEQSLQQARVQMLEQQFNYLNSLIDLEYALGVPFGTISGRRE
jgi:outer membrane protein TolC